VPLNIRLHIPVQICNLATGHIVIGPRSILSQIQLHELETSLNSPERRMSVKYYELILDKIELVSSDLQHLISQNSNVLSSNDSNVGFTGSVKNKNILNNKILFK